MGAGWPHGDVGANRQDDPQVSGSTLLRPAATVAATTAAALARGEVVLFAIPGRSMDETVAAYAAALAGKIVIDATNKVGQQPANSLAAFAAHVPSALVFRAFNNLGWENFQDPRYGDQPADLFYCGPAGEPRAVVERLISDVGLRPIYIGGPEQADKVDAMLRLWMALVRGTGPGPEVGFQLLPPC